jgi:uncharacterized iron-regulated membrane protein
VTLERLDVVLSTAGPQAERAALFIRGHDCTASTRRAATYDLATGAAMETDGPASAFRTARQVHERLLLDLGWLVTAGTVALLVMMIPGVLFGLPRLRNTVGGWHRVAAWAVLPLIVGSRLTGPALAFGISFTTSALRATAERQDLDGLDFVGPTGSARLVRVRDACGTAVAYRMTAQGLQPAASNWPRILHDGNWGGLLGSIANLVAAVVLAGLLGTGV